MSTEVCNPYTALANVYDTVMAHVDYVEWAAYLAELVEIHAPDNASVLEIGCGTGTLTLNLAPQLGGSYVASDNSPEMLAVARQKLASIADLELALLDFTSLRLKRRYDVVLLACDGVNYACDTAQLESMLKGVANVLRPGGFFLFDQSTPANSINNLSYFNDEFVGNDISYVRSSSYDEQTHLHVTRFVITKGDSVMIEHHEQHAFTRMEMLESAHVTGFEVVAALAAFESEPADDKTERIQWILRRPSSTDNRTEA